MTKFIPGNVFRKQKERKVVCVYKNGTQKMIDYMENGKLFSVGYFTFANWANTATVLDNIDIAIESSFREYYEKTHKNA